jgi:hypothetical protein
VRGGRGRGGGARRGGCRWRRGGVYTGARRRGEVFGWGRRSVRGVLAREIRRAPPSPPRRGYKELTDSSWGFRSSGTSGRAVFVRTTSSMPSLIHSAVIRSPSYCTPAHISTFLQHRKPRKEKEGERGNCKPPPPSKPTAHPPTPPRKHSGQITTRSPSTLRSTTTATDTPAAGEGPFRRICCW